MNPPILPTTLVGSYSQPDWLIDRARQGERLPARVRASALSGVDLDNPGTAIDRTGKVVPVPRVTGPIVRAELV